MSPIKNQRRRKKRRVPEPLTEELLNELLASGINETFGYQIFMGQRGASRDKILQLAFAMNLTLRECNRLLKLSGANELYCKNKRDAIIIFCLDKGYTLQKTDDELYRFGEETIS